MARFVLFLVFVVSLLVASSAQLSKYNIVPGISTSGVSAGGAFSIQYHVAFSKSVIGVGGFAAPPYYCAQDQLVNALTACTVVPSLLNVNALWSATSNAYSEGVIDNPANLANDRVWLFTGTEDTVVFPGVVQVSAQYYQKYVPNKENVLISNFSAEHAWITDDYGNYCGYLGKPFINNCNFDGAGALLQHIYNSSKLAPRGQFVSSNLLQFDQTSYIAGGGYPSSISFDQEGYVYVPTACQNKAPCKIHVTFHGCQQGAHFVQTTFVTNTGLNEWAESNNIIVLYPQVTSSYALGNPEGCFDWWGYTGPSYATQQGPQLATIQNMVKALGGKQ